MVISYQKTGTHLMQGLMLGLGYKMAGVPRPEPDNVPAFTPHQRRRIAALAYGKHDYERLLELEGSPAFVDRTDQAWTALGWSWQRRLGQRVVSRYGQTRYDYVDRTITNPHISYTKFADTPPGLCWIFHELDLAKVDGGFLSEWIDTGEPALLLNYRDPRDALISMINFLERRTRKGYGNFYEYDITSAILATMPTWEEKIEYALCEQSCLGLEEFRTSLWMLRHPGVCKVRFEELVGPRGGGSRASQVSAVARLLAHIRGDQDPEKIADTVYNPDSWSFYRGQIGAWREYFSPRNTRHFAERFGHLLAEYGYE